MRSRPSPPLGILGACSHGFEESAEVISTKSACALCTQECLLAVYRVVFNERVSKVDLFNAPLATTKLPIKNLLDTFSIEGDAVCNWFELLMCSSFLRICSLSK